jgi:hypothetical protein
MNSKTECFSIRKGKALTAVSLIQLSDDRNKGIIVHYILFPNLKTTGSLWWKWKKYSKRNRLQNSYGWRIERNPDNLVYAEEDYLIKKKSNKDFQKWLVVRQPIISTEMAGFILYWNY